MCYSYIYAGRERHVAPHSPIRAASVCHRRQHRPKRLERKRKGKARGKGRHLSPAQDSRAMLNTRSLWGIFRPAIVFRTANWRLCWCANFIRSCHSCGTQCAHTFETAREGTQLYINALAVAKRTLVDSLSLSYCLKSVTTRRSRDASAECAAGTRAWPPGL